jgi:hypothetical protein
MQFVDYAWRFATVPASEIALRLWQNVAHGGALALAINGTFDQQDRQALDAARPVFRWIAERESYYTGQESAARVILLGAPASLGRGFAQSAYRGMFRLLTEEHIPFAVTDNTNWLGKRDVDLVVSTGWAPAPLLEYARSGGKVLLVTPEPPEFPLGEVVKRWPDIEGYVRVREPERFPSLSRTTLMMLDGPFTELRGTGGPLTLVPPSMIGPPEFIHIDQKDTQTPAMSAFAVGKGQIVWVPWDAAGLYMRHSLAAHAGLLRDLIDGLMPRRQIRTDAHPLVEMSLMRQGARTLLHLVNVSGHSQSAYHEPLRMSSVDVAVEGRYGRAVLASSGTALPVRHADGYSRVVVPTLRGYELVAFEK